MRIGIDASCWENKRGFGRFTREIIQSLVRTDCTHEYFLYFDGNTLREQDLPENVSLRPVKTKQIAIEAASSEGRRDLGDVWAMTREVRNERLDLFFFPAVYSYYPIINRTKIIVTIHDMIPEMHPEEVFPSKKLRRFWKLKRTLAIWQSSLILTVSEYSKKQIMDYCQLPESKVAVIPEGPGDSFKVISDTEKIRGVLKELGLTYGERFLLYVGGLSPHKNLRMLLEVFCELVQMDTFADVRLVLVGDYQHDSFFSDYGVLKEMSEGKALRNRVVFTGFIEDPELACVYNAATCLVFPSLLEGFGLPAIEAMACGTPVLSSNAGSLPEVLGEAGAYFNPYDKKSLLAQLQQFLSTDELGKTMKMRGLMRAQTYTWQNAVQGLLAIFQRTVSGA